MKADAGDKILLKSEAIITAQYNYSCPSALIVVESRAELISRYSSTVCVFVQSSHYNTYIQWNKCLTNKT